MTPCTAPAPTATPIAIAALILRILRASLFAVLSVLRCSRPRLCRVEILGAQIPDTAQEKVRFAWNPNHFPPAPPICSSLAYRCILAIRAHHEAIYNRPNFLMEDFMHQSKGFVYRITAFLLLSAAFLAQCALLSHIQKTSKQVSNSVGQSYILIADGTLPPPPPTKLPPSQ